MRKKMAWAVVWGAALSISVMGAQAESSASTSSLEKAEPSLEELAQKSNNPISDVWMMVFQNDTTFFDDEIVGGAGIKDAWLNNLKFQPVMPIPIMDQKWNLIFRPVFQYNWTGATLETPGGSRTVNDNGFGDTILLTLVGPNRLDGTVWGVGMSHIFPTANDEQFGQESWQMGPALFLGRLGKEHGKLGWENWNFGMLAQQWWDYAGWGDGANQLNVQYFINWRVSATGLIGMTPNITVNWDADGGERLAFPVGVGYVDLFKLGKLPVRWGLEFQYYVVRPDTFGADWNIRCFFTPIIPNLLK